MNREPVLEVSGLSAGYGRTRVLHNVSLNIPAGAAVGLAGLNGAGKTTLLRALSGTISHRADRFRLTGTSMPRSTHRRAVAGLAHVPEGRRVFTDLSVVENLLYGAAAVGVEKRQARADLSRALDLFPALRPLLNRRAGQLSGGEQQMLAIGRGLMARPCLLLIDEMTLGLSPRASREIAASLAEVRAQTNAALLLVEQNVDLLHSACNEVYVLSDGQLTLSTHDPDADARTYF